MWIHDINEMCELLKGSFPYYLLAFIPLLMIISPVSASHEFPVYRMQQYDLHGVPHGCRSAGLNLEARSVLSWSTSRHCVLVSMDQLKPELFRAIRSKAGALVVVLPKNMLKPSPDLLELEAEMMAEPVPIPTYFVPWSPDIERITEEVAQQPQHHEGSALQATYAALSANGYQLVISSAAPVAKEASVASVQGLLLGRGVPESLSTIAIVAHMDALGVASELAYGGDSNGSGVAVLLEIARIFSILYKNQKTHGRFNILFLVSGAGKLNYLGSKKFLEDQIDGIEGSLLQEASFVMCLDSLSRSPSLFMHVSKPPRDTSASGVLLSTAQSVNPGHVHLAHKKINLADEMLAWEHERYSIRRLPAFTLSAMKNHRDPLRTSIFDTPDSVNLTLLEQNAATIVESLARVIYNSTGQQLLGGQLKVETAAMLNTMRLVGGAARPATLLAAPAERPTSHVIALRDLMLRYLTDVRTSTLLPDRRDPDLVLYDSTAAVLHVYSVKPAVFDLLLTVVIVAYLAVVYLLLAYFPDLYSAISKLVTSKKKIT